MTGSLVTPAASRSRLATVLAGPSQGWLSLVLLLTMLAATGLAIDEPRWMGVGPGGASQTGLLPLLMVGAGITGFLLACSRLTIGWVDLIAALIGTAAGLLFAATAISGAPSLPGQLRELNVSLAQFLKDVLVQGNHTQETSAFLITVSALAWTSGVYGALSIFRRSNALGAVVPIGAMLMLEILAQHRAQDIWLVVFATASLLLVLRLDLEEQRELWLRRRIGGGQGVGGLFLRGGAAVVALMLVGSLALTATASSTSLSTTFPQLDLFVADIATRVQGLVGVLPTVTQGKSGAFPDERAIGDTWTPDHASVFEASGLSGFAPYWRGAAYDTFDGTSWKRTDKTAQDVPADEDPLGSSRDGVDPDTGDYDTVDATITNESLAGQYLPAPQNPVSVDRATRVWLKGDDGPFQVLESNDKVATGDSYQVTGLVPAIDSPDGLTSNELIAGGNHYESWLAPFRTVRADIAGPGTVAAAAQIRQSLKGAHDAYSVAAGIQALLSHDPHFHYDTNISTLCRPDETVSDCLLRTGRGFCQQYATTMVMLLRQLHVPSRYVEGFLPGQAQSDGSYLVDNSAAHAWVEVWFNGVGWVPFDPTPSTNDPNDPSDTLVINGQQRTVLQPGPEVPPTGPTDTIEPDDTGLDGSFGPFPTDLPEPTATPTTSPVPEVLPPATTGGEPPTWVLIAAGILGALLVLGGVAVVWLRRFPGREPDLVWRGVTNLATRFGFGPRPSQTPYEYTVALSKVVPRVASDLRVVADAKVEATYAGSPPTGGSVAPLRKAYRRVRAGLLRLWLRRPDR